jgi:deoxycytidylate deaminase
MSDHPPPSELIVGLVGAVGTDLDGVSADLTFALTEYGYDTYEIRLSELLGDLNWNVELPEKPLDKHIWTHMDAGNRLRLCWERGDAMALLATAEIAAVRGENQSETYDQDDRPISLDRFAFILRSLKHPKEVELLRSIYGNRFVLVAAYSPDEIRREALTERLKKEWRSEEPSDWFKTVDELMDRDEAETEPAPEGLSLLGLAPVSVGDSSGEEEAGDGESSSEIDSSHSGDDVASASDQDQSADESEVGAEGGDTEQKPRTADEASDIDPEVPQEVWGQNLRDTFHRADFFVDAREDVGLRDAVERVIAILFSHPFRTPKKDEYGLFAAAGAARQSAELGRQVGAAIATVDGEIVALGSNEVPKAGGGVYWENGTEETDCGIANGDGREFQNKVDTNDEMKREIALEIIDELSEEKFLRDAGESRAPALIAALERTRLGDLIEFGRAVHAEMAALMDAARRGVPVKGCTLYTTTFPCHNCARHIVAAGIKRVVYVAPYSKSQAQLLHGDAIDFARAKPREDAVQFEPFVGVSPRRYLDLFESGKRKEDDGSVVVHNPSEAALNIPDADLEDLRPKIPSYRQREALAIDLLIQEFDRTGLRFDNEKEDEIGGK